MIQPRFDLRYWVPVAPDGSVTYWLMRQRRKEAVTDAVGHQNFYRPDSESSNWASMRRQGWRIVKIRISPVEDIR